MEFIASPHFKAGNKPELIVLHYSASGGIDSVIQTFKSPNKQVSSHYVVGLDGRVVQMVKETDMAFHAGISYYGSKEGTNNRSIGIEVVNWGMLSMGHDRKLRRWTGQEHTGPFYYIRDHYWDHFPIKQVAALSALCKDIIKRYPNITIVSHSDVAPGRKEDIGPAFPMEYFLKDVYA